MSDKYGEGINGLDKEVSNAQCDQIRLFLKGLAISIKSSPNILVDILGLVVKQHI